MKINGITEVIEKYAQKNGITKAQADKDIKSMLEVLSDCIVEGGVAFRDLFTIKIKTVKGRTGTVNNKEWKTEDSKSLKIVTGKSLKDRLNG